MKILNVRKIDKKYCPIPAEQFCEKSKNKIISLKISVAYMRDIVQHKQ
jgi:hypothetical protein